MEMIFNASGRMLALVTFKDVCNEIMAVNPELGKLIKEISPSDDYKFIKASYLYGDIIIKNGIAQFPDKEKDLIAIDHTAVNEKIKKEIFYSTMPMFMTLKNDNEVFVNTGSRIIPLNLFHAGSLGGVYEAMDFIIGRKSKPIWSYSAGSRTIIMLPKIADKLGLKRLKTAYDIPSDLQPKDFTDHWYLFKAITRSKLFKQEWNNEILFFGAEWLKNKNDSPAWKKLKDYWLCQIWTQTQFVMDKIKFNFMWSKAIETISSRRLQPKPYLIDQVKHVFSIAAGHYPAFKPIKDTQQSAPTNELQRVFVDVYKLKQYLPTMMHACTLTDSTIQPQFVYYSWALPTVLEGSPLKSVTSTTMADMRDLKQIIETIEERCLPKLPAIEDLNFLKEINFDYFHYEKDVCGEIHPSSAIPEEDNSFLEDLQRYSSRCFCAVSRFFSGCLRISIKRSQK